MCEFFSFAVRKDGTILALLGNDRMRYLEEGKNPDSHSLICEHFGVNEDDTWKFQIEMNAEDVKKLAEAPPTFQTLEDLESYYDGGLDFQDFPVDYLPRVQFWLSQNIDKIVEAGNLKYSTPLAEMIIKQEPARLVIHLAYPRSLKKIEEEVVEKFPFTKSRTKTAPNWWVSTRIYDGIAVWFKIPRQTTNDDDLLVSRLFVNRYRRITYSADENGNPVKHDTIRILVYPILDERKEGENI